MKQLFIMLLLLAPICLQAQKVVEERMPLAAGKQLELKLDHASDIVLKGWDKQEVLVKAIVQINGGSDNDALRLDASTEAGKAKINSVLDKSKITSSAPEDCTGSYWQQGSSDKRRSICMEVKYEVWLPKNAPLKLTTISGNITASDLTAALDLHSISGFIDVSWPAAQQASWWMKSVTGELYTDLDMQLLNQKEGIPIVGYELEGKTGKGGTAVRLETISSNIYLRRK